jgi:hypothetical protein
MLPMEDLTRLIRRRWPELAAVACWLAGVLLLGLFVSWQAAAAMAGILLLFAFWELTS